MISAFLTLHVDAANSVSGFFVFDKDSAISTSILSHYDGQRRDPFAFHELRKTKYPCNVRQPQQLTTGKTTKLQLKPTNNRSVGVQIQTGSRG